MTFYSARKTGDRLLTYSMNPLLRGIFLFMFLSLMLTLALSMTAEDFRNAGPAGKINTFLMPLLFFLGSTYRYSLTFDRERETCTLKRGLVFLHTRETYGFDDVTGVNFRVYDFSHREDSLLRGMPLRRDRADFGFFLKGKLILLERNAPRKGAEALYLIFISFYPRHLQAQ